MTQQLGGAASLAAAMLVSVATVIAQGPPVRGPWTDRVLTTLPPGIAPATHAWDSWIVLTPDLSRFAYAARFRSGRFVREAIVDGARRGPAFQYASRPVISPNGEHLVYISVPEQRGDDLPAFLEAGRWRVQIQID